MHFFKPYAEVIRLRVIANSDDQQDQAFKYAVRDAVLKALEETTLSVRQIRRLVRGLDPASRVRFGYFYFGGYTSRALQITLGAGAGQNWWGILYPAFCNVPETATTVFDSWFVMILKRWGWL